MLPYVFEAKAGNAGARSGGATAGVSRRESGKYSKSQKKH